MTDLLNTPSRGRHRAVSVEEDLRFREKERSHVPQDIRDALRREFVEAGDSFDENVWDFTPSMFRGWVAASSAPTDGCRMVAISGECRTRRVSDGLDPREVLADLEKVNSIPRAQIEFLLLEHNRFHRGAWHLVPVADLGWFCSRTSRFGRQRHYIVARNRRIAPVTPWDGGPVQALAPRLERLIAMGSPEEN